jgi:hypothetical protein
VYQKILALAKPKTMRRLIIILVCIPFLVSCSKKETHVNDIKGKWYLESITDKTNNSAIPNTFPTDTIIIYFENATAYSGHTHKNSYTGTYSFDGLTTLTMDWPLIWLYPEDQLGDAYIYMIRGCYPGYNTCGPNPVRSTITLDNGKMFIDNQGKFKAVMRKLN